MTNSELIEPSLDPPKADGYASQRFKKMNHIKTFIYLLLLVFIISSLSCFSSLQTAKTTDGIGLATGLYRYEVLRHWNNQWENHYFLILAPSIGRSAKENRVGIEGRLKFLTDIVDKDREPLWFYRRSLKYKLTKISI